MMMLLALLEIAQQADWAQVFSVTGVLTWED